MHRLTSCSLAVLITLAAGCGGKTKPADKPTTETDAGESESSGFGSSEKADGGASQGEKKDECVGFDIASVEDLLLKSSCEEPNVKPDSLTNLDLKGKLEVTASASPTKLATGGGKVDVVVVFANKTKEPLTLHFRIDPIARFDVEVANSKGKRADMPAGNPPPPPKGQSAPPASEVKTAKLTIGPGGNARARVSVETAKMKWAPEKVRGTPPERGYPRVAAGPLPKGKYTVKVMTPLVGISEGVDHEMSAPKVEIEIEK